MVRSILPSRQLAIALALLFSASVPARAQNEAPLFPFVLPADDHSDGPTNLSAWLDAPAGKHGPIVAKGGHLYAGTNRIRFFGVNLCFGANFPTHQDAERVAARMAKFGINAVRFHHMDMMNAPNGIFAADGRTLDPGQLDKLDYLIAQLKKRGIYVDLNLHVSRTYPGLPTWDGMPSFHKGVDNFVPRMIELQRDYARDLLTHRNPYTGTRYVDEPAVAFIEINNENALMFDWWGGRLDAMPGVYADELARQWNAWLKARYPRFADLKRAWNAASVPLGKELLANGAFSHGLEGWNLEQHAEAKASAEPTREAPQGKTALRLAVEHAGKEGWHVQLAHPGLQFDAKTPYTVSLRARADANRRVAVGVSMAHEPWQPLWMTQVPLTTEWADYAFTFRPSESDRNARLIVSNLGGETGKVWFADVSLRIGGVVGLAPDETEGHVRILTKGNFGAHDDTSQRDWIRFLWDTEERYWTGMYRYVKEDLKAHALVFGTQMVWSPAPIQAKLDVIDSHAYWQHPRFPKGDWDPVNWEIQNIPMAGRPGGGTLPNLALSRVAGKPFLCTEYNHSAPNTYASEAFPLLAAFAAVQDWDGIFAFAYCHRHDDWSPGHFPSFFDIDQHPTKMATLPAAVAMFVRGDVHAASPPRHATVSTADALDRVKRAGPYLLADAFGVERKAALEGPVALALEGTPVPAPAPVTASKAEWTWGGKDGREVVTVNSARSRAVIGSVGEETYALGNVSVRFSPTRQGWAALTLTAIDGDEIGAPGRILITASGDVENTAMGWKNAEKTTVGRDWGRAPSLVEGIPATINLPVAPARLRAWALDERGQRTDPVEVRAQAGKAVVEIGPRYRTLWYEFEIRP